MHVCHSYYEARSKSADIKIQKEQTDHVHKHKGTQIQLKG